MEPTSIIFSAPTSIKDRHWQSSGGKTDHHRNVAKMDSVAYDTIQDEFIQYMAFYHGETFSECITRDGQFDDVVSNGRIFDNEFTTVLFQQGSATASTADSLFSAKCEFERDCGSTTLSFFVSCDETVLGRCASVCTRGGVIAATLIDSRLATPRIYMTIGGFAKKMQRFWQYAIQLHQIRKASETDGPTAHAIDCAIEDGAARIAIEVKESLIDASESAFNQDDSDCEEEYIPTPAKLPDVAALFANARGPVKLVDANTSAVYPMVTLFGGGIAIVYDGGDAAGPGLSELTYSVPEIHAALIRFQVHTHDVRKSSDLPYIFVFMVGTHMVVCVHGVSLAHVAFVIDEAVTLALKHRRRRLDFPSERSNHDALEALLTGPCNRADHTRAIAARVSNAHLKYAMARCVNANLESIKKKLWAPDAPLCRKYMENATDE